MSGPSKEPGVWHRIGTSDHMADLLEHPSHRDVAHALAELLVHLRSSKGVDGLFPVQEHLLKHILEAEELKLLAQKRYRQTGKGRLDVDFWHASVSQLRSIGDAIAWRFLGYRRKTVLFLGRNRHAGYLFGKTGTAAEWQACQDYWQRGEPCLLTGLTKSITETDLLVWQGSDLRLREVKSGNAKIKRRQASRLDEATYGLTVEPSFVDSEGIKHVVIESAVPLRTHWSEASKAVDRALKQSMAYWVPNPGVAVQFYAPFRGRPGATDADRDAQMATEMRKHGGRLGGGGDWIPGNGSWWAFVRSDLAPISVLPLAPEHVAALLSGDVFFNYMVSVDYLAECLNSVGIPAEVARWSNVVTRRPHVLEWHTDKRMGAVHPEEAHVLGIELIEPMSWARGMAEFWSLRMETGMYTSHTCYENEAAVWR